MAGAGLSVHRTSVREITLDLEEVAGSRRQRGQVARIALGAVADACFSLSTIAHAVWLYFRFPLSLRLVEEMLLERGIVVSYKDWIIRYLR